MLETLFIAIANIQKVSNSKNLNHASETLDQAVCFHYLPLLYTVFLAAILVSLRGRETLNDSIKFVSVTVM
jgi:hypothetical protein